MPLYGWILIVVGVIVLAVLKVKVGGAWLKKRKEKRDELERLKENDE
jgi:hypothetical protein